MVIRAPQPRLLPLSISQVFGWDDNARFAGCDRDGGATGMLERAHERRKLISGAPQNREQVYDEACHDAGMSAQHKHKANEDRPANSPAHDYRSSDAASIPLPTATQVATTTATCSLLARVPVAPETRLIEATYPHAPSAGMSVLDRGHAGFSAYLPHADS